MRGSFGGSYGLGRNGPSGGGGGGGGMMRTVGRVMRTRINGMQDPFPSSSNTSSSSSQTSPTKRSTSTSKQRSATSKHVLCVSSPACNNNNCVPLPVSATWPACPYFGGGGGEVNGNGNDCDDEVESEWEFLEDYYDPIFGAVPSTHEVQHALLSLQQVLHPLPCSQFSAEEIYCDIDKDVPGQQRSSGTNTPRRASSTGSNTDWIEPSMQYDQRLTQSCGWETVYDAFHLLETEPSVQKMVVSLSSDKAVWDAVLNNEAVREIRDAYLNAAEVIPVKSEENSDSSNTNSNVLKWMIDHMKEKLLQVLGNITQFVGDIFKPLDRDKAEQSEAFSEKLKSTFLLTVLVLLIVVVTRGSKT